MDSILQRKGDLILGLSTNNNPLLKNLGFFSRAEKGKEMVAKVHDLTKKRKKAPIEDLKNENE